MKYQKMKIERTVEKNLDLRFKQIVNSAQIAIQYDIQSCLKLTQTDN
jgi:DNA replication initiation complex subunit (GINS family)